MGKKNQLFSSRKFVLSVGDEGAILILIDGKKLEQRFFIESPQSNELSVILAKEPSVPVYMLIDVLDQAYIQHALPPVSALNIGQLVKRRLAKDFADEDIKAARKLYRESQGRKDWNYSFISLHSAPPFSEWLEKVVEADNSFKGIYLLPIETENFIRLLGDSFRKKEKINPEWQVLVSHNKVGGFRQIVYKDGKVIFTRIAQPIGGQAPDVIAGNIEQETLNTIEYVRRLGFDDDEKLDIYIIASRSVKTALETNALRARKIILLTPDEAASRIGLESSAEKTDRFGDVVISSAFANSRPVLKFNSPYTKKVEQVEQFKIAANALVGIIVPIFIIFSALSIIDIFKLKDGIEIALLEKAKAQNKLEDITSKRGSLPENSEQVVEAVRIYNTLLDNSHMPLDFVKKFSELKTPLFTIKRIDMETGESFEGKHTIKASLSILFSNPSINIDRLLEDLDSFTESVREKFKDYIVTFSGMPGQSDTLSLNEGETTQDSSRTLEITIEGPKDNLSLRRGRRDRRR